MDEVHFGDQYVYGEFRPYGPHHLIDSLANTLPLFPELGFIGRQQFIRRNGDDNPV